MMSKFNIMELFTFVSLLLLQNGVAEDRFEALTKQVDGVQTAEMTILLERLEFFENRLLKQERDISELKEKHNNDLRMMQSAYENSIASLKSSHKEDMDAVNDRMDAACAANRQGMGTAAGNHGSTDAGARGEESPVDSVTKHVSARSEKSPKSRTRRFENEYNISFFAKIVQNVHHLGQMQNVIFDTVVTNNGNAYNHFLGAFVAPMEGTYMFSMSLVTFNTDSSHYGFFVNDVRETIMYVNGANNTSDSSSQTIVLDLNELDTVTVKHLDSDKSLIGYHHSMFSGFLVAASDSSSGSTIIG